MHTIDERIEKLKLTIPMRKSMSSKPKGSGPMINGDVPAALADTSDMLSDEVPYWILIINKRNDNKDSILR